VCSYQQYTQQRALTLFFARRCPAPSFVAASPRTVYAGMLFDDSARFPLMAQMSRRYAIIATLNGMPPRRHDAPFTAPPLSARYDRPDEHYARVELYRADDKRSAVLFTQFSRYSPHYAFTPLAQEEAPAPLFACTFHHRFSDVTVHSK